MSDRDMIRFGLGKLYLDGLYEEPYEDDDQEEILISEHDPLGNCTYIEFLIYTNYRRWKRIEVGYNKYTDELCALFQND